MPHTLMKRLSEPKLTGMATALSAQMEQPETYEVHSLKERLARLKLEASVHDLPACQQGYSVQHWRLSRLLGKLTHARADGSYRKQR